MSDRAEKNIILSADELCVALAAAGCSKVRGLMPEHKIKANDVPKAVNMLAKRGFIRSDGKAFEAVGDFAEILGLVGFAPDFYIIRSRKSALPDLCCFGNGKSFAVCELMTTKKGCVRICLCSAEQMCSKLLGEGYFEQHGEGCAVPDEELDEFERLHLSPKAVFAEKDESSRRIFSFNLVNEAGCERYVDLIEYYLCVYISEHGSGGAQERTLYSKEEMCGAICRLVQNDYDNN